MVSRLHQRLGTAGFVLSIIALVVALAGGAYAAGGLSSAEKKQITKESKKFSKKFSKQFSTQGPAGPAGATGAPGAKGADGKNGTNGTNGEDGTCSTNVPTCDLPSGATLAGAWGTSGGEAGGVKDISLVDISFLLNVSPAPTAVYGPVESGGIKFGVLLEDGTAKFFGPHPTPVSLEQAEEDEAAFLAACPGSADDPEAAEGFLCIYKGDQEGVIGEPNNLPAKAEAANGFGVVIPFTVGENASLRGAWAVTAE